MMRTSYLSYCKKQLVTPAKKTQTRISKDKQTTHMSFSSIFKVKDGSIFVRFVHPVKLKVRQ
ncbi:MAG TPA: hypothetical protein VD828_02520 [Candidatus Nitrosotenuis sp.]|nr:hypothetical protein [Candidatus Nitrosotenuis sp.]